MAWRHRTRVILAYITILVAVFLSLVIPYLIGFSINKLVSFEGGSMTAVGDLDKSTLIVIALILLGVSVFRGFFDFARTYLTDSLSQKVSYDFRNLMYDKLQHLSFAFHDKEHTGNLMSKATADVEAVNVATQLTSIALVMGSLEINEGDQGVLALLLDGSVANHDHSQKDATA